MAETVAPPIERPRRLRLDWVSGVLLRPRQTFEAITAQNRPVWLTPLLILTVTALLVVAVAGPIKQAAAASGEVQLPPDFQWWTPEQQAQFQQAMAATSGPVFLYVFPALMALLRVWFGWLIMGGLLHLVLTLLGGRGDTGMVINVVAWASLPLALRDLVRVGSMLANDRLVNTPGLAGFAPTGEGNGFIFLSALLGLVDIYLIWHAVLLVLGVRAGNGLTKSKVIGGVLATLLLVLAVQAGLAVLSTSFGNLTIIRAF